MTDLANINILAFIKKATFIVKATLNTILWFYLALSFNQLNAQSVKYCTGSYYITLKNDTVYTTIKFLNIIDLQHRLSVYEKDSTAKTFLPDSIRGFHLNGDSIFDIFDCYKISDSYDKVLNKKVFKQRLRKVMDVYTSKHADKRYYFESVDLGNHIRQFVHVIVNSKDVKYLNYYKVFYPSGKQRYDDPKLQFIELLIKNKKLINPGQHNYRRWIAKQISDYTFLSKLVRQKKFNPLTSEENIILFNEYKLWKESAIFNPRDTSLLLKGIIDADRFYKSRREFSYGICFGTLNGLVLVLESMSEKRKNQVEMHKQDYRSIKIPDRCKYRYDKKYASGYILRAGHKQKNALSFGLVIGSFLGIGGGFAISISVLIHITPKH